MPAQINNDIYVVTVPYLGATGAKINVKDASKAAFRRESSPNLVANSPVGILADKLFIGH